MQVGDYIKYNDGNKIYYISGSDFEDGVEMFYIEDNKDYTECWWFDKKWLKNNAKIVKLNFLQKLKWQIIKKINL